MQSTHTYADAILDEPSTSAPNFADDAPSTAIGAAFADRERAHDAVHRLHDEGFRKTWIGITRRATAEGYVVDEYADNEKTIAASPAAAPIGASVEPASASIGASVEPASASISASVDDTRVESENWFMRFFGEGDESLHDALVRHGVSEADARGAGPLPADCAVLTVDGGNHPELAAQIISECGGQLISRGFGATGFGTTGAYGSELDQAPASRTTSLIEDGATVEPEFTPASYDDYGRYRAGVSVDESTRLQLREERLRVDKSPISGAQAPGATEDLGDRAVDAPGIREDVFFERGPASITSNRRSL